MGESRSRADDIEAFMATIELFDSLSIEKTLKESEYEATRIASSSTGKRYILKELVAEPSKKHPYELLEGHTCRFLPKVYATLKIDKQLKVLMELVEGETLYRFITDNGPQDPREVCELLTGAIRGIDYLHSGFETPLIHRDIKPDNIIIANGTSKLIDFGIARTWQEGAERDTSLFGTEGYAAPEQFGFSQTDARTDIYALGMTTRFALTGKLPQQSCELAPSLQRIIDKATSFDPQKRYDWVGDFYADFKAVASKVQQQEDTDNCNPANSNERVESQCIGESPRTQETTKADEATQNNAAEAANYAVHHEEKTSANREVSLPAKQQPGCAWRGLQVISALLSVLFATIGYQMLTDQREASDPIGSFATAIFLFTIPLMILADPLDVLRNHGFFDKGTGKRMVQVFGIGLAATILFMIVEAVVISVVP